jgi:hypothetical protein
LLNPNSLSENLPCEKQKPDTVDCPQRGQKI